MSPLIYVPKSQHESSIGEYPDDCVWEDLEFPDDCVWDGPEFLTIKAPLQARYQAISVNNLSTIKPLFTDVLDIDNCDGDIICDQLSDLSESGSNDFDRIKSLYTWLWNFLSRRKSNKAMERVK